MSTETPGIIVFATLTPRWCPTHRVHEMNPPGRLRCSAAWRDLYAIEGAVDASKIGTADAVLRLGKHIDNLVMGLQYAPTGPNPQPPPSKPPQLPPQKPSSGNGTVQL